MRGERTLLALALFGVPALTLGLVVAPSLRRTADLRQRLDAAHAAFRDVTPFVPLAREERAFLEAPGPWRTRLAWVPDDAARLAQVDRVVAEVGAAMAARGVRVLGMRAVMDPVRADFTPLPAGPGRASPAPAADTPDCRVDSWVLDLRIAGPTGELFRALSAVAGVNALLEPVGLTWEAAPDGEGELAPHGQHLLLRNLYLKPGS